MILKLLINFYRWLWGMKPLVIQTTNEGVVMLITFGACIDIGIIIWIVGNAILAYKYRRKARK